MSDFSKSWMKKWQKDQDIIIQIMTFLQFNAIIDRVFHKFSTNMLFLTVIIYMFDGLLY